MAAPPAPPGHAAPRPGRPGARSHPGGGEGGPGTIGHLLHSSGERRVAGEASPPPRSPPVPPCCVINIQPQKVRRALPGCPLTLRGPELRRSRGAGGVSRGADSPLYRLLPQGTPPPTAAEGKGQTGASNGPHPDPGPSEYPLILSIPGRGLEPTRGPCLVLGRCSWAVQGPGRARVAECPPPPSPFGPKGQPQATAAQSRRGYGAGVQKSLGVSLLQSRAKRAG